jgi:uncharacterized DUF497 family protein
MHVYIQWDEAKRRENFRKHGVDFAGLTHFFEGPLATREDGRYAYLEARFRSIGLRNGVVLCVVWTPVDSDGTTIRLISAREATQYETQEWFEIYAGDH